MFKKICHKKIQHISSAQVFLSQFFNAQGSKKTQDAFLQVYKLNMGQQQEKLNNYFNQVPKIQIKIYLVRGKATLFDRIKIFWISAMADLQEIIKTHTKSYPSYLDTYPRNGKTTVCLQFITGNKLCEIQTQTSVQSRVMVSYHAHNQPF